jgi:hypothetical protein
LFSFMHRDSRPLGHAPQTSPACAVNALGLGNEEACYWPNTGYGGFGAKVTMDRAPRFDNERRFDPRRILLTDIDGSRTADLQPPT